MTSDPAGQVDALADKPTKNRFSLLGARSFRTYFLIS